MDDDEVLAHQDDPNQWDDQLGFERWELQHSVQGLSVSQIIFEEDHLATQQTLHSASLKVFDQLGLSSFTWLSPMEVTLRDLGFRFNAG